MRHRDFPNLLLLQLFTDEGITGLGETYLGIHAVETYVHEAVAPELLGRDPLAIRGNAELLRPYLGALSTGAEVRGNSAVDIACWDILGKVSGMPLFELLGGRTRDRVPAYNTCKNILRSPQDFRGMRGRAAASLEASKVRYTQYEDYDGFMFHPVDLAHSLLDEGIRAMKIHPFDHLAFDTGGRMLSVAQMEEGLEPFRKIRAALGSEMELLVELHGLFDLPAARLVVRELEEFQPYWVEDPVRGMDVRALALISSESQATIATGESLGMAPAFARLIEGGFSGVLLFDVCFVGGLTEALKLAAIADAHQLPVAAHDCNGPVVLTAETHLAVSLPNAIRQEVVRSWYHGHYQELVTALPILEDGTLRPPDGPGLGIDIQADLKDRPEVTVRRSSI